MIDSLGKMKIKENREKKYLKKKENKNRVKFDIIFSFTYSNMLSLF